MLNDADGIALLFWFGVIGLVALGIAAGVQAIVKRKQRAQVSIAYGSMAAREQQEREYQRRKV